jgi:hypothetical protein
MKNRPVDAAVLRRRSHPIIASLTVCSTNMYLAQHFRFKNITLSRCCWGHSSACLSESSVTKQKSRPLPLKPLILTFRTSSLLHVLTRRTNGEAWESSLWRVVLCQKSLIPHPWIFYIWLSTVLPTLSLLLLQKLHNGRNFMNQFHDVFSFISF